MQFGFQYASGTRFMYSAMTLRDQLKAALQKATPRHDEALHQNSSSATARAGSWCG